MAQVRFEVDSAVIAGLLQQGSLCVAQLRALDPASKAMLWQLCLESCAGHRRDQQEQVICPSWQQQSRP
ncbi:hypothetical protein [Ferrimonas marina]|uniref:Uncharacterized protein n=1 Tax=Ferrimonas marina TaxID=299255 RepID=A0A1M5XYA7_9GAMM|nr:hypothetical protein [Ferrimonas marina]SHI04770.1 hypothetical protein SAMN02745129_3804 [Ferrimonas marina]